MQNPDKQTEQQDQFFYPVLQVHTHWGFVFDEGGRWIFIFY